jgi:hypothetical protein
MHRGWSMRRVFVALIVGMAALIAANQTANASASLGGNPNASVKFRGNIEGLTFTGTILEQSAFSSAQGNATANALTHGGSSPGILSGTIAAGISLSAQANGFGHAIAEARQVYDVVLLNTADTERSFGIQSWYVIGTGIFVSDTTTSSAVAHWEVGVKFITPGLYDFGEFNRTIDCTYPAVGAGTCQNFYDLSDDMYGNSYSLGPGETLEFQLVTIARYEVNSVPEPSTMMLFSAACALLVLTGTRIQSVNSASKCVK